jgi:hypothetical protein
VTECVVHGEEGVEDVVESLDIVRCAGGGGVGRQKKITFQPVGLWWAVHGRI